MLLLIYLLALLVTLAGVLLVLKPELVLGFITRHAKNPALYASAIIVRLVFGLLLVTYAGLSRFPLTVTVIGWLSVIAAVVLAWIGRERFIRLLDWVARNVTPMGKVGGILAIVFGVFLLYAFL